MAIPLFASLMLKKSSDRRVTLDLFVLQRGEKQGAHNLNALGERKRENELMQKKMVGTTSWAAEMPNLVN